MNELPNELIEKILNDFVPLKYQINCRLICKKWKNIIDHQNSKSLIIFNSKYFHRNFDSKESLQLPFNAKWFISGHEVNCKQLAILSKDKLVEPIFSQTNSNLLNLKKLFYHLSDLKVIKGLSILNEFIKDLRQLELLQISSLRFRGENKISHQNLKCLKIEARWYSRTEDLSFLIDCPKLEMTSISRIELIDAFKFVHLDKVKYLEYQNAYKIKFRKDFVNKLPDFNNLEYLICTDIQNLRNDLIEKFRKLKVIQFNNLKEKYNFLQIDRQLKSSKDELKICLNNIQSVTKDNIQIILDHYSKLPKSFFNQIEIVYDGLDDFNFPIGFGEKFFNLKTIHVINEIKNKEQFYNFLKECSTFGELKIKFSSLDQNFYSNLLPLYCPFLKFLTIKENYYLNCDFVLKFKNLFEFYTNQPLSNDLKGKLFDKFSFLGYFRLGCFIYGENVTKKYIKIFYTRNCLEETSKEYLLWSDLFETKYRCEQMDTRECKSKISGINNVLSCKE